MSIVYAGLPGQSLALRGLSQVASAGDGQLL
jgi:hypothetical protein